MTPLETRIYRRQIIENKKKKYKNMNIDFVIKYEKKEPKSNKYYITLESLDLANTVLY